MHLLVTPGDGANVSLEDPDDCTRLHVEARGVPAEAVGRALATLDLGHVTEDGDHAGLRPDGLRQLAEGRVAGDWPDRFRAMLDYAGTKGWVDDAGLVRAHIELR